MKEYKLCPFCGGEARQNFNYARNGYVYVFVECDTCGAKTKVIRIHENYFEADAVYETPQRAWNRRTNIPEKEGAEE